MGGLVEVKGVKKHFEVKCLLWDRLIRGVPVVKAVDGVDLDIQSGETFGLVGESGSGKSTLGRVIVNLCRPSGGKVFYRGKDTGSLDRSDISWFRKEVQMVFQNPYSSLNPRKTVRQILHVPLAGRGLRGGRAEAESGEILNRVGLAARYLDSYPHQLSGGQRQRVAIARAIAVNPGFIVADEPVSALDVSVQAQIIELMQKLQEEMGLTYLFISHDLGVVNFICSRVAVMYLGRIVEVAGVDQLFSSPAHPYTEALLSAVPSFEREGRRERIIPGESPVSALNSPAGCSFQPRCHRRNGAPRCAEERPDIREISPGHFVACHCLY